MPLDPRQIELAVLIEVIELHPDHLTPEELVLRLSGKRNEEEELNSAIRGLKDAGLLRDAGDAVAPTGAALCAAVLFML
jgi:hypothetical protein